MYNFQKESAGFSPKKIRDILPPDKKSQRDSAVSPKMDDAEADKRLLEFFGDRKKRKTKKNVRKSSAGLPQKTKLFLAPKPFKLIVAILHFILAQFLKLGRLLFVFVSILRWVKSRFNLNRVVKFSGIVLVGLLLVWGIKFMLRDLPRATIVLSPTIREYKNAFPFTGLAGQFNGASSSILPVTLLSFEVSESLDFISSGKEDRLEKAKGVITVYNNYSSAPQALIKTTRFIAEDGHLFRTLRGVTIPGAKVENGKIVPSSIDVEVEAAEPGKDYNIGPSTFSIPGFAGTPRYLGFYGKSKIAMQGGFIGEVTVVSKDDLDGAREKLRSKLEEKARQTLSPKIPPGLELLSDALNFVMTRAAFSKKAGDRADGFSGDGAMLTKVFMFKNEDFEKLLANKLGEGISAEEQEVLDSRKVTRQNIRPDFEKQKVQGEILISTILASKLSRDTLLKELIGQKEQEVQRILSSYPGVKKASVTLWPFWVRKVPTDTAKIRLDIISGID